jgi:hypothetical protein
MILLFAHKDSDAITVFTTIANNYHIVAARQV